MSGLKIRHAALTDVGVKRSHNQDACAAKPAAEESRFQQIGHIFIVADGMGGHAVGEKASAMAVRGIPLTFEKYVSQEGVVPALKRAFQDTNAEIHDIGRNNPEFRGLGTTGTVLILRPEGAWIGHVGDSRVYRIRGGKVEQLTFDHSWVWEIARRQGIDPDELGDFKKNVIVRSLGPDAEVQPDIEGPHPVEPGDIYLLCSDGLSNLVPADELGAVVTAMPPQDAVNFLIELANIRGGPDNITAVVVQVPGTPSAAARSATPRKPLFAGVKRGFAACDRHVPWSYSMLALSSLTAVVAAAAQIQWLFALAAVGIVAGIIGLILHFRKGANRSDTSDAPGELHIYKDYDFEHNTPLINRFAEVDAQLSEMLKDRADGDVDWTAHAKWTAATAEQLTKADPVAAFRAKCKAVEVLATAINRERSKEEAFSPNYK